jgi:hypothetical protein
MSVSSFGPKPPYEDQDTWAQECEKSTDAYNSGYDKKLQDEANLQNSVNQMYACLKGGKDDYWKAIMCGTLCVLFGTLTKGQDDNNLAMLGEGSTADAGGLMSNVTELWTNGQSYDGKDGGMTEEQGKQLFMEESDLWYFLHAPSYNDTGKSMSWFWDDDLKNQISSSMSDSLIYFEVDADPDNNLPLRDDNLDETGAQMANWTNAMWYNAGSSNYGPPSQEVSTVLNDFQVETTTANSQQTGFNSDYENTTNTINSIMSGIYDCLSSITDLTSLSVQYMAPK